ncbi:MAG: leucine-rich repeat domain-containing protein [Eggerthellaceae bacterium]|nr:leucine-rich repeat domain-containing protein [Eggerthellaceae bacterium]
MLLQNTEKKLDRRVSDVGVSMGLNLSADTSKLEVCFGGFAPTAMNAGFVSDEVVEKAEARTRERREELQRADALEAARASDLREWEDAEGTVWQYVLLDGADVRILKCKTSMARLTIPAEIEGKPVVSLASDACAYLTSIEEVVCPDSIISAGYCVFRGCKNLRRAIMPSKLATFDSGWFRNCDKLEYLKMPGYVERLESSVFDLPGLKELRVGAGTLEVAPGAFGKSNLNLIEVDGDNPFLASDGKALYTKDGSVFVALAVPVDEYCVADGCKAIARKGFSNFVNLTRVDLPETVEVIDAFAYSRTSVSEFVGPKALRFVGEKAFFNCRNLKRVSFAEGLTTLEQNALTGTKITELTLPSTVEELGNPLAADTALIYAGPDATFRICEGSQTLQLDEFGGLYRRDEDGLKFVLLLDLQAKSYEVREGVKLVCPGAFANHVHLAEVQLPEGLVEIGAGAFKGSRALRNINVPESVRVIADEAFLDTNIESIYLPANLERLGVNALITQGAHYSASVRTKLIEPSLHKVVVGEGNNRFKVEGGLLLERAGTDDTLRVLLCTGAIDVVRIPAQVNEIAPYAFNNVRGIRELYLSDRIVMVGIRGLAVDGFVELIHIDLVRQQYGRDSFELRFPGTDRGAQQMMLALSVPDHVNVEAIFSHYDTAVTNGSSFDSATEKGLELYEQATRLLQRLLDPVFLAPVNRNLCERFLSNNVERICVALAKHDDRAAFDAMLDLGFLNADNIYAVIERIGAVQDATITNYLLEARRMRFEQSVFDDFDL